MEGLSLKHTSDGSWLARDSSVVCSGLWWLSASVAEMWIPSPSIGEIDGTPVNSHTELGRVPWSLLPAASHPLGSPSALWLWTGAVVHGMFFGYPLSRG